MKIQITDDFDLEKIADSGQCFRWEKEGIQSYRIIAGRSCLYITALDDRWFELDCTETEFDSFWRGYFDLQEDYRAIRERIEREKDPFLWKAARQEKGIRILRQDPWEMLVTFIISQNRNIPAIRRSVEMLAETCGERREDKKGRSFYVFPNPAAVASLSREALDGCRIGYRGKYVKAAARAVVEGTICLEKLCKESEEGTIHALVSLYGVGVKVASCISLFGLHHVDAFPVDVWMKRILAQEYPDGYPFERYAPYNGIYQQYMFAYYRHQAENRQKLKAMIIPAGKGNLQDVKFITHTTIQAVYPKYYPGGEDMNEKLMTR